MIGLAVAQLRGRPSSFVGTFAAVALAVALVGVTLSCAIGARDPSLVATDPERSVLGATLLANAAAIAALAALFVGASTLAQAVRVRSADFARLRLAGAAGRRIAGLVVGESLLIGVVAAAVGGGLALVLTPVVAGLVSGTGFAPAGLRAVVPAWPILIAIGSGLAVVLIGSLPAARSAARIPAIQALRDAAVPALRMTAGRWALAAVLLVGIGLEVPLVLTAPAGVASAYLVLVILTVVPLLVTLSPVLFAFILAALAAVSPRAGLVKVLLESARTAMTRTAAMTTPVLVSLALGAGLLSTTATTTATLGGDASADVAAIATVIGVTLAYSGLSIVVTSAIGTSARRDEFAALRLAGLLRRSGLALVVLDVALVLTLSALLAALAVAAVCVLALAQLSSHATPMLAIPAAPIGLLLAGCAVLLTGPALVAAVPALRGR